MNVSDATHLPNSKGWKLAKQIVLLIMQRGTVAQFLAPATLC